jgi:hypothetical protein
MIDQIRLTESGRWENGLAGVPAQGVNYVPVSGADACCKRTDHEFILHTARPVPQVSYNGHATRAAAA